jgi:hypothetical protein
MRGVLLVFAAAGCGFRPAAEVRTIDSAAATPDAPAVSTPDADLGPWGSASPVFTGQGDDDPTLTGDLLELFFNRNGDIYEAPRGSAGDAFGAQTEVAELSSGADTTPEITYDGLTIYLASTRSGSLGGDDIWMATRADRGSAWSTPIHVDALGTTDNDVAAAPSADGLSIVLCRDTPGNYDLYESTRATASDPWGTPVALASINTPSEEQSPMLSADKLAIYYDSNSDGTDHLWMATRASTSDPFGNAVAITSANTLGAETDAWISPDSHVLFFASGGTIYQVSR